MEPLQSLDIHTTFAPLPYIFLLLLLLHTVLKTALQGSMKAKCSWLLLPYYVKNNIENIASKQPTLNKKHSFQ